MRKHNYIIQLFLLIFMLFSISCSDSKPQKLLVGFSDDLNSTTVDLSRKLQIRVYADFDDTSKEEITNTLIWSSSDKTVATVELGLVTTLKIGNVDISYKGGEESDTLQKTYTLKVKELELLDISLSSSSLVLNEGETHQLQVLGTFIDNETSELFYQDITEDCRWESKDTKVLSVNTKGYLTAISKGFTSVNATSFTKNASVDVEVKDIKYTSIELNASKTKFNVEQSISLYAVASSSEGQTILLDSSELEWSSSDNDVVSLDESVATAKKLGEVTITAILKNDRTLQNTFLLSVEKENYLRLFKNGVEVEFPFAQSSEVTILENELDSFTLRAVGQSFTLNTLVVKDFKGNIINSSEASFSGINEGEIVAEDSNVSYKLLQTTQKKELEYSYSTDDVFSNSFSQKYKEID